MPPQADSGRVHLPAGKSLPVFGRRHNALVRKASIIKATQEGDEKKILFQVSAEQNVSWSISMMIHQNARGESSNPVSDGEVFRFVDFLTPDGNEIVCPLETTLKY